MRGKQTDGEGSGTDGRGEGKREKKKGWGQWRKYRLLAFPDLNLPACIEGASRGHGIATFAAGSRSLPVNRVTAQPSICFCVVADSFVPSAMPKVVSRAAVSTSQDGPYQLPTEQPPIADTGSPQPNLLPPRPQTSAFTVRTCVLCFRTRLLMTRNRDRLHLRGIHRTYLNTPPDDVFALKDSPCNHAVVDYRQAATDSPKTTDRRRSYRPS